MSRKLLELVVVLRDQVMLVVICALFTTSQILTFFFTLVCYMEYIWVGKNGVTDEKDKKQILTCPKVI